MFQNVHPFHKHIFHGSAPSSKALQLSSDPSILSRGRAADLEQTLDGVVVHKAGSGSLFRAAVARLPSEKREARGRKTMTICDGIDALLGNTLKCIRVDVTRLN